MGPMRDNWSFPKKTTDLIQRCKELEQELVDYISQNLEDERIYEEDIAKFREHLRVAGVRGWETAMPEDKKRYGYGDRARDRYLKAQKKLETVQRFRAAFEYDLERDPNRQYKLSHDDLIFFGFN